MTIISSSSSIRVICNQASLFGAENLISERDDLDAEAVHAQTNSAEKLCTLTIFLPFLEWKMF